MEHHRARAVGMDQPVLGAPPEPGDPRPAQRLDEIGGERAAQVGAVDGNARDPPAVENARQPADRGFDFGELGHGLRLLTAFARPAIASKARPAWQTPIPFRSATKTWPPPRRPRGSAR